MQVKFFGRLAEITGKSEITIAAFPDILSLMEELNRMYHGLGEQTYLIALNRKVVSGNHRLQEEDELALLPPFSGG